MNTDGSGLKRLTTDGTRQTSELNIFSQYPWSNVSRDGNLYTALQFTSQGDNQITTLSYGSLNGGVLTTVASIADGTSFWVAGWTTM